MLQRTPPSPFLVHPTCASFLGSHKHVQRLLSNTKKKHRRVAKISAATSWYEVEVDAHLLEEEYCCTTPKCNVRNLSFNCNGYQALRPAMYTDHWWKARRNHGHWSRLQKNNNTSIHVPTRYQSRRGSFFRARPSWVPYNFREHPNNRPKCTGATTGTSALVSWRDGIANIWTSWITPSQQMKPGFIIMNYRCWRWQ